MVPFIHYYFFRVKDGEVNPPPAVEQGEAYENQAAEQNMGPHVPQLV